jgi:hypothetical protein
LNFDEGQKVKIADMGGGVKNRKQVPTSFMNGPYVDAKIAINSKNNVIQEIFYRIRKDNGILIPKIGEIRPFHTFLAAVLVFTISNVTQLATFQNLFIFLCQFAQVQNWRDPISTL